MLVLFITFCVLKLDVFYVLQYLGLFVLPFSSFFLPLFTPQSVPCFVWPVCHAHSQLFQFCIQLRCLHFLISLVLYVQSAVFIHQQCIAVCLPPCFACGFISFVSLTATTALFKFIFKVVFILAPHLMFAFWAWISDDYGIFFIYTMSCMKLLQIVCPKRYK